MANYFVKNLKYIRNQKKISQQELADKIGVDRSTIGYWENGKADPTLLNVQKLSDALNINMIKLVGTDLSLEENQTNEKKQFSEEEKKEALKQVLKDKGFFNENEEISKDDVDKLIDFAKRNKDYIIDKKEEK